MREDSGVAPSLTALPSGGGGVAPLGERFQPDLLRGSGSYAVPIRCPRGPNDLQPSLSLTYSTGSGNGPFGLGWRVNALTIERRCSRGVPTYTDADEFVLGEAEILVPVGDGRYRPRVDSSFWLVERLGDGWRVRTGDGKTMLFGQHEGSRESDGERVFAWHLDEESDPAGNRVEYSYRRDGNRLYLEEVRYSIFRVRIRYEPRPDVLRNGRAGFLRLTALRAVAIEIHCDRLDPTLMRTYALRYEQGANGASLLAAILLSATRDGETAAFPELSFRYSELDLGAWSFEELEAPLPPPDLEDARTQIVDLVADGLPDVLQTLDGRSYLWRNDGGGRLSGPFALPEIPSALALDRPNVAFADLDGNGRVDLFAADQALQLAFESDGRGGFDSDPIVFREAPSLRLAAANTRLMDVDADGVTDLIATERNHLLLFRHVQGVGWQEPAAVQHVADLDRFPDLDFRERGVRLADLTGDGLQDFVVIRSGDVSYWPYLGNGRWGERVRMDAPPLFPAGYREERVQLLDVDGDGCADVVYADSDRTIVWLNRSGSGYAPPVEIPVGSGGRRVLPVDFHGDGRPALAWSAPPAREDGAGYRTLRLAAGTQPYLLTRVDNGMGGRFEVDYASSTELRVADQRAGRDWQGLLPFPVHVVRRIREHDTVAGRTAEFAMHYRDGVYDGLNHEFRGFARVEVELSGDDSVPASRQEVEFFLGDPEHPDPVERDRHRALAGTLQATRMFEVVGDAAVLRTESLERWEARLESALPDGAVFFPFLATIETREHGRPGSPVRIERTTISEHDAFGNARRRRRESFAEGDPQDRWIASEESYSFTANEAAWLVKLPVRSELRDRAGRLFANQIRHYDGPPFEGLIEGDVEQGLPTSVRELRLAESQLPDGYLDGRDLRELGYERLGDGDDAGWYATTLAVARDARGNVVEHRDPTGVPIRVAFDDDGVYPVKTTDARGRETELTFEPFAGEPRETRFADGRRVRNEYDAIGRLAATFETDDDGAEQLTKCWLVDLGSTPASTTSIAPAAGGRTRSELTSAADLESLEDVSISRMYYDGFGKAVLEVSTGPSGPDGARRFVASRNIRLNARGLVAEQRQPAFVPDLAFAPPSSDVGLVRQRYDVHGDVVETAGPGPAHFRVVRDTFSIEHFEGAGAGPLGAAEPPGPPCRVEQFDARGRLVRCDEAVGDGTAAATVFDLSLDGRVTAIRDADGGEIASYAVAGPGEAVRIAHRDVGARSYYRDTAGRLVERVDAVSRLSYAHDEAGRLARIESSELDGSNRRIVREIVYDEDPEQPSAGRFLDGRVAVVREAGNSIRYSYDRVGKTVLEEFTTGGVPLVVRRRHDLQGRLTRLVYPDGHELEYQLDESGSIRAIPGFVDSVAFEADGALAGYHLANGVEVSLANDPDSRRLERIVAEREGTTLRRLEYRYDPVGTIAAITDELPGNTEHRSFRYDGLYRLSGFEIQRDDAAGLRIGAGTYAYDAEGNLRRLQDVVPLTLSYDDAAHPGRLTSVANGGVARAVAYDPLGNVRSLGELAAIEYDPLGRVSRIEKGDGTALRLAYDHQSRRILKEVVQGAATVSVQYAAGVYERHDDHAFRHIYLADRLVASERVAAAGGGAATTAFFVTDHHSTVVLATDPQGAVLHQQRYSAFGLPLVASPQLDRYLGRERDVETGLIHLGARYYAPEIGRFISPDWWILENPSKAARLPQGYNLYAYALNNPLVFKDPSGQFIPLIVGAIVAIAYVAAVATVAAFAVGFVAGLIYGLANGQGWGSLLTALETGLTTVAGMWLGGITGFLVGGPVGAVIGAIMGGMNGLIGGMHGIYDWSSIDGWFAFLSDSTWGLLGTSLGNIVHVINLFYSDANYRNDLSHRQNRHVYEGGFALKSDFAFTQGNVISNAGQGGKGINASFIANHEELHIWQQRFFGPLFQLTYVAWAVGGFLVASVYWLFNTDKDYGKLVETAAYYDNPFEYWAYKNDSNWPPSGVDPSLAW